MGTRAGTFTDSRNGRSITGWNICQFVYKHNTDGDEWWTNEYCLLVDEAGNLWEYYKGDQYEPHATPERSSSVNLNMVDGEQLRMWHTNGWDFAKMKRSIEAMV
ncbi:hypothetical protein DLJ61_22745 [Gordonia terrae]|uniref:Uncharacterized protein n=2 Tax=Gordonia terrae TaxID=2055 RepID=A0AAD0KCS2_9ACTN|nr:hypothetical protein BCM27_22515 [Gordonia terrae]AWO85965.1 hypothetical protein DLJ61_22745 [Gordonia terrae]